MAAEKRGILIVLEGLDKAGKSTQCTKLTENLRRNGRTVLGMRFPGAHFHKAILKSLLSQA